MDPLPLTPAHWDRVARLLVDLTASVGLTLSAAFALLLGRAIVPWTAEANADGEGRARTLRRLLYPIAAVAAITVALGLGRAIVTAVDLSRDIYPRLLI